MTEGPGAEGHSIPTEPPVMGDLRMPSSRDDEGGPHTPFTLEGPGTFHAGRWPLAAAR
jgi:hypothetical protein